jgi:hypothetical protein
MLDLTPIPMPPECDLLQRVHLAILRESERVRKGLKSSQKGGGEGGNANNKALQNRSVPRLPPSIHSSTCS